MRETDIMTKMNELINDLNVKDLINQKINNNFIIYNKILNNI